MGQRIALFNHKGGVAKTITVYHLGEMLASKGKTVVMVDADPQCDLSALLLGTDFEKYYRQDKGGNLLKGLEPAFKSIPRLIQAVDCVPIEGREGLYLLPGHLQLAEYETTLGFVHEFPSSLHSLQNVPGALSYLLDKTAKKLNADYVLIDMNPSLSSINQNLLMTSDFFLVPSTPDFFSVLALQSLAAILFTWHAWAEKARSSLVLKEAIYSFPQTVPKFLGIVLQWDYEQRWKQPYDAQKWVEEIAAVVRNEMTPVLQKSGMLLSPVVYTRSGIEDDFLLASIRHSKSQERGTIDDQSEEFQSTFSDLAGRVIGLTKYATSP